MLSGERVVQATLGSPNSSESAATRKGGLFGLIDEHQPPKGVEEEAGVLHHLRAALVFGDVEKHAQLGAHQPLVECLLGQDRLANGAASREACARWAGVSSSLLHHKAPGPKLAV